MTGDAPDHHAAGGPTLSSGKDKDSLYQVRATSDSDSGEVVGNVDHLKRSLGNRQIQLIAIGGSIGTGLFVSIGSGLMAGGPGSLLLAYSIYACFLGLVNSTVAEMCVYLPISGSFIRFAGKWVDDAFGFMAGWNFFFYQACLIPFEISALNLVLGFWRDDIPVAAVCTGCIALYAVFNLFAVRWYGEAEFWLSSGKLFLIILLFAFTFFTMIGANPQHDAYGFRSWITPGAFREHITTGSLGRFEGFLGSLWSAAFTVVGPEYLCMVAGEAERPRTYLKQGFKTVYWRFGFFFIGGALCVGIVLPSNDATLNANAGAGTAKASPYVIAMANMGVAFLPHLTNALLVTSIFSAGNAYTFCAMRSLYGLALEGQAPAFFKKCTRHGVPYYAFFFTMLFPLLSFLSVGHGTAQAVTWLVDLTEAAQIIDYIIMCVTYIFFYKALQAQGINRNTLPYKGWGQPYVAYVGATWMALVLACYGYSVFLPGRWSIGTFFSYYTMVFVCIITYTSWKLVKRSKVVQPLEADLIWEKPVIDAYEASLMTEPDRFWRTLLNTLRWWKK